MKLSELKSRIQNSQNKFLIHIVRHDPIHKTLHVTVEFVGVVAPKFLIGKKLKDGFYKEQAKELIGVIVDLMPFVHPKCKKLELHVR